MKIKYKVDHFKVYICILFEYVRQTVHASYENYKKKM